MRKITSDIRAAIRNHSAFKGANTTCDPKSGKVTFHGSVIAVCEYLNADSWSCSCNFCGYVTNTTRDRINAVRGVVGLPLVGFVKGVPTVDGKAVPSNDWF